MDRLPFRQIHLDFHTSESIPGVGRDWDKGHFQEMLALGRVSSITVFAKCHHGWCYYPTRAPLSLPHPSLRQGFDLTGAMIEAAHEIGVQTPVYVSCGFDEKLVRTHSHWLRVRDKINAAWGTGWLEAGYHEFCMRSPYLDYLTEQIIEIVQRYDMFEGLFLDIVNVRDCCCQYCFSEMVARGMDPRKWEDRRALGRETYLAYARRINEAVQAIKPHLRIFHNGGHIPRDDRELAGLNTHHLELESLPTGGWGYDHFPLSARYVQGLGKEFLGMTGKFHTSWGEFGGYKHPNALRYEAALSLANGAKVSVGDQMHPFGRLDRATYALIGAAYREVEEKEPWCRGVSSVADVGLLSAEAVAPAGDRVGLSDAGAVRVLQEGGLLYDVLDPDSDFGKYQVLLLPDAIPIEGALRGKLQEYLRSGGKVFATWESGLDPVTNEFALDFGVSCGGQTNFDPEYIVPGVPLAEWDASAFVIYSPFKILTSTHGTVLADRQDPFFNRDMLHFCSHQHAPNTMQSAGPAIVATNNTVYMGVPAFRLYADKGQNVLREIILGGIRRLLPRPTLQTGLPAQGVHTVMRQPGHRRTVVHLLYGAPVKRGSVEVIEDLVPLREVPIALRVEGRPERVYLAPQGEELPFTLEGGLLRAVVPEVHCHQMVVVE